MASSFSGLASIAGKAGLIGELLGVDKDDVTLGSFVFDANSVEVPGEMPWGVKQQTARHLLPGGVVVIQSMGADWPQIHWKGYFEGPTASSRCAAVAKLAKIGDVLTLTWLDRVFRVVIAEFDVVDITDAWASYRIKCDVMADTPPVPPGPSLGQQIIGDISSAVGFNVADAASQAATVLAKVQQAASVISVFTGGTGPFAKLASAAGIAGGVIGGAVPFAERAINAGAGVVNSASSAVTWLSGAVTNTGNLAQATAANGYVTRLNANLAGASH